MDEERREQKAAEARDEISRDPTGYSRSRAQSARSQGLSQSKKHMWTWYLQENFHLEKAGSLSAQLEEKNRAFYGMIYFKMECNQRSDLDSLG